MFRNISKTFKPNKNSLYFIEYHEKLWGYSPWNNGDKWLRSDLALISKLFEKNYTLTEMGEELLRTQYSVQLKLVDFLVSKEWGATEPYPAALKARLKKLFKDRLPPELFYVGVQDLYLFLSFSILQQNHPRLNLESFDPYYLPEAFDDFVLEGVNLIDLLPTLRYSKADSSYALSRGGLIIRLALYYKIPLEAVAAWLQFECFDSLSLNDLIEFLTSSSSFSEANSRLEILGKASLDIENKEACFYYISLRIHKSYWEQEPSECSVKAWGITRRKQVRNLVLKGESISDIASKIKQPLIHVLLFLSGALKQFSTDVANTFSSQPPYQRINESLGIEEIKFLSSYLLDPS